jgi:hypothetical protein
MSTSRYGCQCTICGVDLFPMYSLDEDFVAALIVHLEGKHADVYADPSRLPLAFLLTAVRLRIG